MYTILFMIFYHILHIVNTVLYVKYSIFLDEYHVNNIEVVYYLNIEQIVIIKVCFDENDVVTIICHTSIIRF